MEKWVETYIGCFIVNKGRAQSYPTFHAAMATGYKLHPVVVEAVTKASSRYGIVCFLTLGLNCGFIDPGKLNRIGPKITDCKCYKCERSGQIWLYLWD